MKRKSIKIIALLLVLIFVLGGCGKAAEKASDKTSSESSESSKSTDSVRTYSVGETWEVEGLWKFKVNSVTTHFFCNTSTIQSQNSGQVVTISYTYENTGYEYISPLYITSSSFDLYDERGELAFVYNCDHVEHPKFCDKYFECTAQQVFVLKNYSSQLKLKVSYFNPETNGLSEAEFVLNITTSDTNNQSPIQSSESSSSSSPNTNNNPSNSTQPPATPSTPSTPTTPTQPSTPGHTHSYSAATCTTPAKCSCGATNGSALGHSYSNGKCVICGTSDPNYKTPDIILGEYIQKNGTKLSNGKYALQKNSSSNSTSSFTQITWDPNDKSLIFGEQSTTSVGVNIYGVIFKYGANKQQITSICEVSHSKFTGIGYIRTKTYTYSQDTIEWVNCECTYPDLIASNKRTSEACILMLMSSINNMIKETNLGISLRELGFVEWIG